MAAAPVSFKNPTIVSFDLNKNATARPHNHPTRAAFRQKYEVKIAIRLTNVTAIEIAEICNRAVLFDLKPLLQSGKLLWLQQNL
jgi:hypothetical protein